MDSLMDLFEALKNMLGLNDQPQTQDQYFLDAQKRSGARTDTQDGLATLSQFMAQDPAGQQFAPQQAPQQPVNSGPFSDGSNPFLGELLGGPAYNPFGGLGGGNMSPAPAENQGPFAPSPGRTPLSDMLLGEDFNPFGLPTFSDQQNPDPGFAPNPSPMDNWLTRKMSGMPAEAVPQGDPLMDLLNLLTAANLQTQDSGDANNPFQQAYNLASRGGEGNMNLGASLLRNNQQNVDLGNEAWASNPRVRAIIEAQGGKINPLQAGANMAMKGMG